MERRALEQALKRVALALTQKQEVSLARVATAAEQVKNKQQTPPLPSPPQQPQRKQPATESGSSAASKPQGKP